MLDDDNFAINPKTGRIIKKGGALHYKLLKEALLKKGSKKNKEFVVEDEPIKTRKQAPKRVIGKANVNKRFAKMDMMSESELSDMEAYISRKLNKTKLIEPVESDIPETEVSETEISESSESSD